jgi:DNA-binding protein H-NS
MSPAVLPLDLEATSDEVLALLATAVPAEQSRRKAKREADFFALIEEQARVLNIPPARLAAALRAKGHAATGEPKPDGRSVVRPKYRCPADRSLTWSGRGNEPKWFTDAVAAGTSEAAMRIPDDEA